MVTINFRNNNFIILFDGEVIVGNSFIINDYQKHSLLALPITDSDRLLPLCGAIQSNALANINLTNNYDYITIKTGEYELLPQFSICPSRKAPSVISQSSFEDVLVTVYIDGDYHALFEDGQLFISHITPTQIENIDYINTHDGVVIVARGRDYIVCVLKDSLDFHLIYESHGCNSRLTDDGFELEFLFEDSLRRRLVERYQYCERGFLLVSANFEYRLSHTYIPELLPILLIDAIMANDLAYANTILALDLAQNISQLINFFGKILCYYEGASGHHDSNKIRLLCDEHGQKFLKTFRFTHNSLQITDITQDD